jgi:hypothetical protein
VERFKRPALWVVVAAILLAGAWPGTPLAENQVDWRTPAPGLWFEGDSQSLSEEPIWTLSGELTLELWIEALAPPLPGNQEIVSFVDGPGTQRLLVGRFPNGLFLRGRLDNPTGDPRRDRYLDLPIEDGVHHLAVTVGSEGAALYVDGRHSGVELPATRARAGERFGGRLLLGTSGTGSTRWRGAILAVAVHQRILDRHELTRHASIGLPLRSMGPPAETVPGLPGVLALTASPEVTALYLFDEGHGRRAANHVKGGADLILPKRLAKPTLSRFFARPAPRWTSGRWSPPDLALNIAGFAPLGILIAWGRGPRGAVMAVLWGLTLSLAIELLQPWIPGRHSSLVDLVCNGVGALLGGLIGAARRS